MDIGRWETCVKFQQKKFNPIAGRVHFFRQNTWCLGNIGALSKFSVGF